MSADDRDARVARAVNAARAQLMADHPTAGVRGYLAAQLGEGLTKAREAAGKSQRAAARDLGIAGNTLRELELGLANPTLSRIEDLAADLGLKVELKITRRPRPRKVRQP